MSKIKELALAEAIPLMATMSQKIERLDKEIRSLAIVSFEKGDKYDREEPAKEISELLAEMGRLQSDLRTLKAKVSAANRSFLVALGDGEEVSLEEALLLVKDWRGQLPLLRYLAQLPDKPRAMPDYYRSGSMYQIAAGDPKHYRSLADRLERQANRLSVLIDRANLEASISIDPESEFDPDTYLGVGGEE